MNIIERVQMEFEYSLSQLFPVTLPKIVLEFTTPRGCFGDAFAEPVLEDGIMWHAYDVRRTGIERHND